MFRKHKTLGAWVEVVHVYKLLACFFNGIKIFQVFANFECLKFICIRLYSFHVPYKMKGLFELFFLAEVLLYLSRKVESVVDFVNEKPNLGTVN